MNVPKEHYHLLDALRGFALLHMLAFHFCYDLIVIFGQNYSWYRQPAVHFWQQFICISFLLLSGISWHFSRNNFKKGLLLNLYGLVITLVTYLAMPSQTVWFGILNCIGCCTLLTIPLGKFLSRFSQRTVSPKNIRHILSQCAMLLGALFLFLLCRNITNGYLTYAAVRFPLPASLYQHPLMAIFGFPHANFSSSDYFPILPWFWLFLAGFFLWGLLSPYAKFRSCLRVRVPFLSAIGRKTIWIYLIHQPILYLLAWLCHQFR